MIGAAVGAVFGGCAGGLINSAFPGDASIAQPQAYALVGMAATLASVCSVPLTSVLLLFELTKDYRILLPLTGAVGLAIWVPSVATQAQETGASDAKDLLRGYSILSPIGNKIEDDVWRKPDEGNDLELSVIGNSSDYEPMDVDIVLEDLKVSQAMSSNYLKVSLTQTLKDALKCMHDGQLNCVLVVDGEDYLEGILTYGDIKRYRHKKMGYSSTSDTPNPDVSTCPVSSICTRSVSYRPRERGLLICYPDTDLVTAKQLMEAKGIKQLPVVKRGIDVQRGRKRKVAAILYYNSIWNSLRDELNHRASASTEQR